MSNPLDEYLGSTTEKRAFLEGFWDKGVRTVLSGPALGHLVGTTGIVAGASALVGIAGKIRDAATKSSDYKKMMEINPDLAHAAEQDPKMFNQYYSSLRNLNPRFAQDPVVAGQYMRKMTEFPTNAGGDLIEAARHAQPGAGLRDFSTALDLARRAGQGPMGRGQGMEQSGGNAPHMQP